MFLNRLKKELRSAKKAPTSESKEWRWNAFVKHSTYTQLISTISKQKFFLENFNFSVILMISNLNQIKKVSKLDWQNFTEIINFVLIPYPFHTIPSFVSNWRLVHSRRYYIISNAKFIHSRIQKLSLSFYLKKKSFFPSSEISH